MVVGRIPKDKVPEAFRGYEQFLRELRIGWELDGYLDADELGANFLRLAPNELKVKLAGFFDRQSTTMKDTDLQLQLKQRSYARDLPPPVINIVGRKELDQALASADKSKSVLILIWSRNVILSINKKQDFRFVAMENKDKATFISVEVPFPKADSIPEKADNAFILKDYKIKDIPILLVMEYEDGKWEEQVEWRNKQSLTPLDYLFEDIQKPRSGGCGATPPGARP